MTQADNANPKQEPGAESPTRQAIFWYNIGTIALLIAIAIIYFLFRAKVRPYIVDVDRVVALAARAMWFGALGGVVISLKGVYDHTAKTGGWDDGYNLWHIGRPLSGAIVGVVTVLLFSAINKEVSEPAVYAAAFIFGTQEKRFFNFLYEVARLVVQVPNEQAEGGLQVADVYPPEGSEGATLIIKGRGFEQGAAVKLGTAALGNVTVAKDGTAVAGVVPKGQTGPADLTITNPSGTSVVLQGKFKYA